MPKTEIDITKKGYHCLRCNHNWIPRKSEYPAECPKCKSARWNKPKKE